VSIVLGWLPFIGGILGIVFGLVGIQQTKRRGERGRGLAIAGLVIGILGALFWLAIIIDVAVGGGSSNNSTV
jgi:hypothetical protein